MRRAVTVFVLGALTLAGLAAGILAPGTGAAPKASKASDAKINISVKASEFKFVLSRRSVPAGSTVVFTVKNVGKISHDFKISGKKTPTLLPGKSAKVTVKFSKKGRVQYICTLPGHAGAGMKGTFSIGVAAVKPPPVTSTQTTTTTVTTTPPTGPIGTANTTVQVGMFEYRFDLSQTTIPSGNVTFVITNRGSEVHNFSVAGGKSGTLLSPGQSETYTVALPPNTYTGICDVPFHAERGMQTQFTVTP